MALSWMAAQIFDHTFHSGDFSGWGQWRRMDDGSYVNTLMLSANGRRNRYTALARTRNPESGEFVYMLCVDQVDSRMSHLSNKFGIMAVEMSDDESRMIFRIDFGEHIVVDLVDAPALRDIYADDPVPAKGMPECGPGEEDNENETPPSEEDEDRGSRGGILGAVGSLTQRRGVKRERKDLQRKARGGMPPKSKLGLR